MDMRNVCISPPCCSTQCRHNGELTMSLLLSLSKCSPPLVYPLYADSPLYFPSSQLFGLPHSILYVMLSALQLPCPNVVQIKQSSLPQFGFLNGFVVCNWLFSVLPVLSITRSRIPLRLIASSYVLFNFPSGVVGMNSTESNPPCLYHRLFFNSFSSFLSALLQFFGRCIGRIPWVSLSRITSYALIAEFVTV